MSITVMHVTREQAANKQPANHPTLQNYSTSKRYITTQRYTITQLYTTAQLYTTTQLYTTNKLYTTTQLYPTGRNYQAVKPANFCGCWFVVGVLCFVVAGVLPLLFCGGCIVIAKIRQKHQEYTFCRIPLPHMYWNDYEIYKMRNPCLVWCSLSTKRIRHNIKV